MKFQSMCRYLLTLVSPTLLAGVALALPVTTSVSAEPIQLTDGPTPLGGDEPQPTIDQPGDAVRVYLSAAVWVSREDGRLVVHDCPDAALAVAAETRRRDVAALAPLHARLLKGISHGWARLRDAGLDVALEEDTPTLSRALVALLAWDFAHHDDLELTAAVEEARSTGETPFVLDVNADATCNTGRCDCGACPPSEYEMCTCLTFEWMSPTTWRCVDARLNCNIMVPKRRE
jgi:hypothetical protein